jgi:hypothetical protein
LHQDQRQVPEQVHHQPEQVLHMVDQYHQLEQVLLVEQEQYQERLLVQYRRQVQRQLDL